MAAILRMSSSPAFDLSADLARIGAPTLIIGLRTRHPDPAMVGEGAAQIPGRSTVEAESATSWRWRRPGCSASSRCPSAGCSASECRVAEMSSPSPNGTIDYTALVQDDRIHGSLYTDPRIFDDEMERISAGMGLRRPRQRDPSPGDFVTRRVGTEPVIMCAAGRWHLRLSVNPLHCTGERWCVRPTGSRADVHLFRITAGPTTSPASCSASPTPAATRLRQSAHGADAGAAPVELSRLRLRQPEPGLASRSPSHLGSRPADRSLVRSLAAGEVELTAAGWKHRCAANWKALHETTVTATISASCTARCSAPALAVPARRGRRGGRSSGRARLGQRPHRDRLVAGYQGPFEWLGASSGSAVADFVAALERRDGAEATRRRILEGPAHALIFPNLFLGETNIADRRAGERRGVRCTGTRRCFSRVSRSSGAPAPDGRGGHGPGSFLMPED